MSYGRVESDYSSPYGGDVAEENTFAPIGSASVLERAAQAYILNGKTESPIETMFGAAAVTLFRRKLGDDQFAFCWAKDEASAPQDKLLLIPQYPWRRFRIDWAFKIAGKEILFVECDGRDFHSTDEQIVRDAKRDAIATAAGIEVLRFTGSSIFLNDDACAGLALSAVLRRLG